MKRFTYNAAGLPVLMSVSYGGAWYTYGYVYDGTGQIVGLVDDTTGSSTLGQEVVTYTYDAWGNLLSDTDSSGIGAATINPFVYKGYWYDWSTGLYDLNARYYNPVIGRFLSEDPAGPSVGSNVPGYNGYAYVGNSPVDRVDPAGTGWFSSFLTWLNGTSEQANQYVDPNMDPLEYVNAGVEFVVGVGAAGRTLTEMAESTGETGTVWDSINATAKDLPGTKIPATFQIKVGGRTLWANANATEHMGEYIDRLNLTYGSISIKSKSMLRSFSQAVNDAMKSWGSEAPGRHFGTFGGWELGINTETGVIYHALMK